MKILKIVMEAKSNREHVENKDNNKGMKIDAK